MGQIIATISEMRSGQVKVPLDTRTKIIVTPDAMQCEILGKLFDPGKTFLGLDSAVEGLRYVHRLAVRVASGKDVLIVAHTEPLSGASKSEQLSRDRAAMVAAWFEGDVQAWLDNYADSLPKKERWGAREDQRMLGALGGFGAVSEDERPTNAAARYDALVRGFQRSRGLTDDGIAGPVTRKQLVQEYFALAKVDDKFEPVPPGGEPAKASVNLTQHGAGPHFSLADTEAKRQAARAAARAAADSAAPGAAPAKNKRSKGATANRAQADPSSANASTSSGADADTSSSPQPASHARLDFFIFFNKEGMDPAPGSADGGEFLEWVALASGGHRRFRAAGPPPKQVKLLPLPGGCFRTGSAVLLPDGSTSPESAPAAPAALSSMAALAMALRFNEERPGHRLLVAGHTDSVGSDKDNDQLSKQRAQLAHAVMMGNRDTFVSLADEAGTVSDWKQILGWASLAFPSIEELVSDEEQERAEEDEGGAERAPAGAEGEMGTGFSACDPGTIDDDASSAKPAVEAFQTAYNENNKFLGGTGTIKVDGIVGKQTWGAIYDLYQYNLAQELGEDFEGLAELRDQVEFLPTKNPYIGFGEHHPADGHPKPQSGEARSASPRATSERRSARGVGGEEEFSSDDEGRGAHAPDRRVEVFFFEQGHEPELGILDEAPELTEMYENEVFVRDELPPRRGGARKYPKFRMRLLNVDGKAMANGTVQYSVRHEGELITEGTADDGWAEFRIPPDGDLDVFVSWATEDAPTRFGRWVPLESARGIDENAVAQARLAALGYVARPGSERDLVVKIDHYQNDYGLGDEGIEPGSIPDHVKEHLEQAFRVDFQAPLPEVEEGDQEDEEEEVFQSEAGCQADDELFDPDTDSKAVPA